MGGEIDAVGPIGHPNHFADADPASAEGIYHQRRCILHHAMDLSWFCQAPQGVVAFQLGRSALGLEQRRCLRPLRPQCSGLKHGLKLITQGMAVIAETFLGGLLLPLAEQWAQGGFHLSQRHLLQHGPCQAG